MANLRHLPIITLCAATALAACSPSADYDMRGGLGGEFNTAGAVQLVTVDRPQPDDRGVISYPTFQVAVARQGDTIADVADRIGLPAGELARFNGIPPEARLRRDEVVALPSRVPETNGPIVPADTSELAALAGSAIDRSGGGFASAVSTQALPQTGREPVQHRVARGETAYTIARLYNISVRSLAKWNGLGADMAVREGQFLMIPVASEEQPAAPPPERPGAGSATPEPPSSTRPLPRAQSTAQAVTPPSPQLSETRSETASGARFSMPVDGDIIRPYAKGKNEGVDIAANAGSPVRAADDGVVAAITRDTDQVPIIVIRHDDNLLTVYAGIDGLMVEKGDRVKRGQIFAKIRQGSPSFLHFEVRQGINSIDPMDYLN